MATANPGDWQLVLGYKDGHVTRIPYLNEDEARRAVNQISEGLKSAGTSQQQGIVDAGALIDISELRYAFVEPETV